MASLTVTNQFKYDVFLSFRGEDTRYGFTGNLKKALDDKGVRTFIDDEEVQKGDDVTPTLLKAIDESMMAIIVLSKNYASSSFCLQELSKILDSMMNDKARSVFPVFYNVNPSDVHMLKKNYGKAMDKHKANSNLVKWMASLHQIADLAGFHYMKGDGYEHEFIGKIVERVLIIIKPVAIHVGDYLVGLEPQKQHVTSLLNVGSDDTIRMVGIHGIGGIGKTTLALEVYNSIVHQFHGSCFLEKVRENSNNNGLMSLQKTLLSKIIGKINFELASVNEGISILQQRLCNKKVLLLIDDVDKKRQLEAIAGRSDWFGPGSRVIITTRDNRLLTCHGVEETYEVKGLNDGDAFDLVGWKALKNNYSPIYKDVLLEQKYGRELNVNELHRLQILKNDEGLSGYANVLKRVVAYASGLPLALEVIGSHFFNKTIEQCEDALARYERDPHITIQTTLETSYDALQAEEKVVFLDIACCFQGYRLAKVEQILHSHYGDIRKDHITVLVEKSLIKINEYDRVTLHDLVENMGKEIVKRESPEDPGKRSRLWSSEDIIEVLQENTGTSKIEIIHFQLDRSIEENFQLDPWIEEKSEDWDGKAFKKMKNLKTLIFRGSTPVCFSEHIPNSLRVLEYSNRNRNYYHSRGLNPFDWDNFLTKKFENMKVLNYDCDTLLTRIPDISNLPNLEQFSIQDCPSLITIDESVGFLSKLKILRFIGCNNLQSVPPLNSASLVELNLSDCHSLESFPPVVSGFLGELKILRVIGCSKIRLIPSLVLPSLEELDLSGCTSLDSFSHMLFGDKLKTMSVRGCHNLMSIPPLKLDSLETLDLSDCYKLESFPSVVDSFLGKLKTLLVKNCHNLRSIPPLKLDSLETLKLSGCHSLESFPLVVDTFHGKLKTMLVKNCRNLRSIPPLKLDSLETLELSDCHSLESFPLVVDTFLGKLKTLKVKSCRNLRIIPPLKLDSLETLELSDCHSLESFPLVVDEYLGKLKTMVVKNCHNLRSIPPLKLDLLEKLNLSNCFMLESFSSVGDGLLDKLKFVNIEFCIMLRSMPQLSLTSLENFNLSCCYSLESFPEILGEMRNIPGLLLDDTPGKESPFPFHNRSQLQKFHRCNCEYDQGLDGNDPKLTIMNEEKVYAMQSSNVKYICFRNAKLSDELLSKTLMLFANVKELHLINNQLTIIPKSIEKCHFLWKLVLDDCKELNEIKGIPPCLRELSALNCMSLSSSCKSKLLNQKLHEAGNTRLRLPRAKIPEWFDHQREAGMSISLWFCGKFPAIALCVVSPHTWGYSKHPVRVIINGITFFYTHGRKTIKKPRPDAYHLHLFHMQVEYFDSNMDKALLENKWNHAVVDFGFPFMFCGIHVLKEKSSMKDIRFTNP